MTPDEHLESFARRIVRDAIAEALPEYWLRRSKAFAQVGTPACDELALACAYKAAFLRTYGVCWDEDFPELAV